LYGPGLLDATVQSRVRGPAEQKNEILRRTRDRFAASVPGLAEYAEILAGGQPGRGPTPGKVVGSRTALAAHLAAATGLREEAAYRRVADAVADIERDVPADQRYLPTQGVLAVAREAGLVSSIAHPLWRCRVERDVDMVIADLERFAAAGLNALESRSYHHRDRDDHPTLLRARERLGLLPSAGSDFHANGKTTLGADGLGAGNLAVFEALVASRPAQVLS
jgi:hypothetical protein